MSKRSAASANLALSPQTVGLKPNPQAQHVRLEQEALAILENFVSIPSSCTVFGLDDIRGEDYCSTPPVQDFFTDVEGFTGGALFAGLTKTSKVLGVYEDDGAMLASPFASFGVDDDNNNNNDAVYHVVTNGAFYFATIAPSALAAVSALPSREMAYRVLQGIEEEDQPGTWITLLHSQESPAELLSDENKQEFAAFDAACAEAGISGCEDEEALRQLFTVEVPATQAILATFLARLGIENGAELKWSDDDDDEDDDEDENGDHTG